MSENTVDREAPKFRVGAALGRIFSVFFRNIVPFGVLGILCGLPSLLLTAMMGSFADAAAASTIEHLIAYIVPVFFWFLLAAAVVYGTVIDLRGGDARLVDCAIRGLSVVVPVIVVGILVYILFLIAAVVPLIPAFIDAGFMVFSVPVSFLAAVIVGILYCVAIPVAVVEQPGIFASMKRSIALTRGSRLRIFGLGLVLIVITMVVFLFFGAFVGVGAAASLSVQLTDPNATPLTAAPLFVGISLVINAIFSALWAVAIAVIYHDLRIAKEGVSADEIATVFD